MAAWYEKAVFYHMYPLGMTGAPRENQEGKIVHRFEMLRKWLPYAADIGCTAIYIGPLFESSTHGYDTKDYKKVDRRLGNNEDFKIFVREAHDSGLRIVVDGVFNHTGREFFAFRDIRKNRDVSPYCSWYKGLNFSGDTEYHDGFWYEAWRNCYELANLNLGEPAVREYLLSVIDFWIEEFDIDGIRLDCADCLDFYFMEEMRRRTQDKKADFWLMGEVIHGDYARYIQDGNHLLHSVTNYELHKGLYSGHNDHNYFEIAHTIRREFDADSGIYRGMKLYSFADNHDVDRIASKLHVKENLNPVYTLLYTLPGIPSLYYGSEWGIEGKKEGADDHYLRPAVKIAFAREEYEHSQILQWVRKLSEIHREHPCLWEGGYEELLLTNRQYAFARMAEGDGLIIAVNNDEEAAQVSVRIPNGAVFFRDAVTGEEIAPENGRLNFTILANQSVIIVVK